MKKHLMAALAGVAMAGPAAAQQGPANDPVALMAGGFTEVASLVTKSAELVPADKYNYKPTPSVRTFAQQVAHVADAHNWYCGNVAGRNTQWSDAVEKGPLDKATLTAKLKESIDGCRAAYNATGRMKPMLENIHHSSLHYGNMVTYLRMLGLTPPSS